MKSLVVVIALVVSVFAGAEGRDVAGKTEKGQIGPVGVSVTPLNLAAGGARTLDFQLIMDTHQGGLPSDLLRAATLIGDTGEAIPAAVWSGGSGGHHLSGTLSFRSDKLSTFRTVTLLLKGIEGRDARFEWKLPPKAAAGSSAGTN